MEIKKLIRQFIKNIIHEEIDYLELKLNNRNLINTSEIARLIIDLNNRKISLSTYNFLCKVNINPRDINIK